MAVAVVTGCSSGIGLESALAFARRGDTTVATMRNLAKAIGLFWVAAIMLAMLAVTTGIA